MTKFYTDQADVYLGGWDDNPPANSKEVPFPPDHAKSKWNGSAWENTPERDQDIADEAAKEARKNVPRQGNGLPEVRAELDELKQALLDAGILTGI